MTLREEYERTLKPGQVETWLDLHFFRPAAFVVVKLAMPTPITPNMLTALSIGAGLAGAWCLKSDEPRFAVLGAGLLLLYGVLDCADGQLARARGTSSRVGRILDGMSDYVVGVTSGLALSTRLHATGGASGVALATLGLTSVLVQGTLFDHFKNRYLSRSGAAYREGDDLDETLTAIEALSKAPRSIGRSASLGLHHVYATFLRVQRLASGGPAAPYEAPPDVRAAYAERLAPIAKGWAYLGPSTHVAALGVALCTGRLAEYVTLRVTVGNAAMLGLWYLQAEREREVAAAGAAPAR